ncbi:Threonylcarbamoyladenosine tRNA methylthiotransferase MtaB [Limihaloglobus sulfuriphilus]|uniref:Threonylcarbamoyladenosine tRNA methylthiotransferase MtaB n=1 Tax=Limihaloglobus sulfuriphilus TaxID=1851148 RepID=A0A1Q2MBZ3_9BACT|nr:tRNA (N(6)-L-threonylcarbamoyladenosine(37)-C(2))-methylthiotransferase MtaB [Limihaloglobus sulfuriphilus]AQQ70201.1 Threonylcarbamoyladenosine tRNA methylthiotransferase MtaB [Limihaloglobus sulfuriphilus]
MNTYYVTTLGCKVNQYESRQIAQLLSNYGLKPVKFVQSPDIAVIHTCCVTHTASSKSRQLIRKIKRQNPDCTVIVTGCLTSVDTGEADNIGDGIIMLDRSVNLPDYLEKLLKNKKNQADSSNPVSKTANDDKIKDKDDKITDKNDDFHLDDPLGLGSVTTFGSHSRAFLKIQDGCDGFCSYCIIPHIRKKLWSNPPEMVEKEARAMVAAGHKEIVLTGIYLSAYMQETVKRKRWDTSRSLELVSLIERLVRIDGLMRLRLSSLEPGDITEPMIECFVKYPNLVPHLHLSLQSGSDRILRRMNRQYRTDEFLETVERLNNALDRPAITTDLIVGFPGETEFDFDQSMEISRQAGFAKIHVFGFSKRRGTPAAKMQDQIETHVIKERVRRLSELDKELQQKFRRQFAGEEINIIVENTKKQTGRCERYFEVNYHTKHHQLPPKKGDFLRLRLKNNCIDAEIL